jgi:hypothetical protein
LDCGGLAVGALNLVKVHDPDGLLGFVLNFLVAMRHKLGDDHAAARQELFYCQILFHISPIGLLRDRRRHDLRRWG